MANRRMQLEALLVKPGLAEARKPKIKRLLWVICGILDESLSIKRLFKVSQTYERIGMIPQGYMQAELFERQQEP